MDNITIHKKLNELESDLNLFDLKLNDIYIWKLIRANVYFSILSKKANIIDSGSYRESRLKKTARVLRLMNYSFFHSTFKRRENVINIFFENPRKIKLPNEDYIDPFTHKYIESFDKKNSSYEVIDLGYKGQHFNKSDKIRSYSDDIYYDLFYKLRLKLFPYKCDENEVDLIRTIENHIRLKFNVNVDVEKICYDKIFNFRYQYKKYSSLFKLKKVENIYLVCSYGKEGLIHAAQELRIHVTEFQHGVMGEYQLNYSYPTDVDVPYFPNKLLMFGKYWSDSSKLPLSQVNLEYIGFDYLTNKLKNYEKNNKVKQIIVLSQPDNVDDLIPLVLASCQKNKDFNHIYRLHPKERQEWEQNFPDLYKASCEFDNLLIDVGVEDLYQQIADSLFVVGVYSAAIFEAIMLDSEIILVDSPGIEYMTYVLDSGYARLLKPNTVLDLSVLYEYNKNVDKNYFYRL